MVNPQKVWRIESHGPQETRPRTVRWAVGNTCVYTCSYCPPRLHDGSRPWHPKPRILRVMQELAPARIILTGGEPTYHPDFDSILEELPQGITLALHSNGARPRSWWQSRASKFEFVLLTFHPEWADPDRFIANAEEIYLEQKAQGQVLVIMLKTHWQRCVEVVDRLGTLGINCEPKPVIEDFGSQAQGLDPTYTEAEREWIRTHSQGEWGTKIRLLDQEGRELDLVTASELLTSGLTDYRGWQCLSPEEMLYIHPTGAVYDRACGQRKKLGSIWQGFTQGRSEECGTELCWCRLDLLGTKQRRD